MDLGHVLFYIMAVEGTRSLKGLLNKEVIEKALAHINSKQEFAVDGCQYELIRQDRFKDMMEFYRLHFVPDETINRSLHIPWDEEVVAVFTESLQQNLSLALVSTNTGEIVGGRIMIVANKNDEHDTAKYKSEPLRKMMDITYHFGTLCDMFQHYGVDEMFHFFGLGVHKDYRQKGIGTILQKAGIEFVRNLGMGSVVIRGEASAIYSQKIYEKLGFELLAVIVFSEYKVNGEIVVKNTGIHKDYRLYGKVV